MRSATPTLLSTLTAVLIVAGAWSPRPSLLADTRGNDAGLETLLSGIRSGVMASVPASPGGSSATQADSAVASVKSFIAGRSGIELSPGASARLADSQRRFVAADAPGTTAEALIEAMTDWAIDDVLMTVTASEIDASIEAARGLDSPDLPETFRNGRSRVVFGTGTTAIWSTPEQARAAIAAARSDSSLRSALRVEVLKRVDHDVNDRIRVFNTAEGSRFLRDSLSPVEVTLIAYSIAAGDYLAGSTAEVREKMRSLHAWIAGQHGAYPTPEGRLPYGTNGYLHSSPAEAFVSRIESLLVRTGAVK